MKRLLTLLFAAAMLIGAAGQAGAADVKLSGYWDFAFGFANTRLDREGHDAEDTGWKGRQRLRTQMDIIASESLQGVLMFEIGTIYWGQGDTVGQGSGGRLDADGVNIETRRAYLDWIIPETEIAIRMGIQGLHLPMANDWCNPVFSADVAGITATMPIDDMFSVTLFWARPFDTYMNDGQQTIDDSNRSIDDEMDLLGAVVPITGDGWKVTPWFMYADIGAGSGYLEYTTYGEFGDDNMLNPEDSTGTHAWWLGTSFDVSLFDPLTFSVDGMYGNMSRQNWGYTYDSAVGPGVPGDEVELGTSGWFVAAALNYELDWGTPGLFGWWSTGDTESGVDGGKYGRMPVVGTDDGFAPTSFGFPGSSGIGDDTIVSLTAMGTWGIGAQLANVSFIEKLEHTLRFAFYRGTNEHEVVESDKHFKTLHLSGENIYLTDKDDAYEVNFNHQYEIYENLSTTIELGYIYLDLADLNNREEYANNAWKAQLLFKYTF